MVYLDVSTSRQVGCKRSQVMRIGSLVNAALSVLKMFCYLMVYLKGTSLQVKLCKRHNFREIFDEPTVEVCKADKTVNLLQVIECEPFSHHFNFG